MIATSTLIRRSIFAILLLPSADVSYICFARKTDPYFSTHFGIIPKVVAQAGELSAIGFIVLSWLLACYVKPKTSIVAFWCEFIVFTVLFAAGFCFGLSGQA
jgi:hypothetical protein